MQRWMDWLLTPYRLAVHESSGTAIIADLHLDYNLARRYGGDAVPYVPMEEQMGMLKRACAALDLDSLVIAGDLCESRLDRTLVDAFLKVLDECRLKLRAVVPGNHDRDWAEFSTALPFMPSGVTLGDWHVIHGDRESSVTKQVIGHYHPAWLRNGRLHPCYLLGPQRLVLPAFSSDAAGGNVRCLERWTGYRAHVIEGERVVDEGLVQRAELPSRRGARCRTPRVRRTK